MNENKEQTAFVSMSQQTIIFFNNEIEIVKKTISEFESHNKILNDYLEKLYKGRDNQMDYYDELAKISRDIQVSTVGKDNVEFTAASITDSLKLIAKFLNSLGKKPKVVDTSKQEKNDD
jgi:hypothetical protein